MNTKKLSVAGLVIIVALLGACASKPSLGDKMAGHGKAFQDIGEQWNKGDAMRERGESLVKKGKRQIEDGKSNQSRGESLIEEGKRLMKSSEERFAAKNS